MAASPHAEAKGYYRLQADHILVKALHDFGFAQVTGHGINQQEIDEALALTEVLFDLPYADKMRAPHPPGPIPRREYSGIGREKFYSQADVDAHDDEVDIGQSLRKILDSKESYEIGSELDPRLCGVGKMILHAIGIGLGLDGVALTSFMELVSDRYCQLRLLHHPAISKEKLGSDLLGRLPAHEDWGTFTIVFQDNRGGLELKDPVTQAFLKATHQDGALILNVGNILQHASNDYFISALHRKSVPDPDTVSPLGIPPRYSIPFFLRPDFSHTVSTLDAFVTEATTAKYSPVGFGQYYSMMSKNQYQEDSV
ncbi:oxidoreductase-like protein [Xylaria telfairii]|nr:oxidoreductase-like protein [Xylaria telfairii]